MMKIIHYSLDNIDKENAIINIIYGERSNGKSYQVKHKKAVEKYLNTGRRFILMRRWKEEITTEKIEQYFQDVDIYKLTDGVYNCISMYKKQLFLSKYNNETGKTTRGDKIGYVVALSTEQNYAGASYLDVDDIIFEEFMSRGAYIGGGESDKLINFYLTVDRKRGTTRMWLVGNTISQVCPYLNDWGLQSIVLNQKQGTIETIELPTGTYNEEGEEITLKCAIEYCSSTGATSFAIGKHKDMLNKGTWQTDPQPHLPKSIKEYKKLFRMGFEFQGFRFIGELLKDDKNLVWFIYPYKKEFKDKFLVISDNIKPSKYYQRNIYNLTIRNDKLSYLLDTFRESLIFYATDSVGTNFKQAIDFDIRR
jgi:hypothetical protein